MVRWLANAVGLVLGTLLYASETYAFKMGDAKEFVEIKTSAKTLAGHDVWVHHRLERQGISFGDPVHEDMTVASKALASKLPSQLSCSGSQQAISQFLHPSAAPMLGNSVCCAKTAKSRWCDYAEDVRYVPFKDVLEPLVSGARWNDDACHMSQRPQTRIGWAAWMVDPWYRRAANLNYSSDYHDKQFLHAMASSGFGRSDSYQESASVTTHKIVTWAEFAFRVAEGSIPAGTPLHEAGTFLEPNRTKTFHQAFRGYSRSMTVGQLFSGTSTFDLQHVRQLAMGALLHTVQDAFSASHVERVNDQLPTLKGRGKVIRFLNYRLQSPSLHGEQDQRPTDAQEALPSDFHPVALGARLIACAANGSSEKSNWPDAKSVMLQLTALEKPKSNPRASAGGYKELSENNQ